MNCSREWFPACGARIVTDYGTVSYVEEPKVHKGKQKANSSRSPAKRRDPAVDAALAYVSSVIVGSNGRLLSSSSIKDNVIRHRKSE